jgi:hypothetical protein
MTATAAVAVHPGTGEVLERLDEQPPETLAEALEQIYARQAQLKEWEAAIAGELRRRLRLRKSRLVVFGDWEVEASSTRSAEWDAEELEAVIGQLVEEGVVRAGDVADVVTHPTVVAKSKANQMLARLTGDARERVAALRTWTEKPGRLTVARSVDLPRPAVASSAVEEISPVDGNADRDKSVLEAGSAPARSPEPPKAAAVLTPLDPEELFAQ